MRQLPRKRPLTGKQSETAADHRDMERERRGEKKRIYNITKQVYSRSSSSSYVKRHEKE